MSLHDWHIVQLVDSRSFGGIESHILNLSHWLHQQGYQCEVVFLKDYGPHPLKQQLERQAIKWRCLNSHGELLQLLDKRPVMLATHGYKAGIIGRVFARICKTPVVSTYHSGDCGRGKLYWYSQIDALTAGLANQVLSVSRQISERLPVPSLQINNFVEPPARPAPKGREIAFVGRLDHEKGPDLFTEITRSIAPHAPVTVYGDGPMRDTLSRQFPDIRFAGQVDMSQHWHNVGLLCITSRNEGLPLAALEAMSHGIPVAAFEHGALPELIQHNRNGWLIQPGDTATFATVVRHWMRSPDVKKAALASSAIHRIRNHYSANAVMPRLIEIYTRALNQHLLHLS